VAKIQNMYNKRNTSGGAKFSGKGKSSSERGGSSKRDEKETEDTGRVNRAGQEKSQPGKLV